MALNANNTVHVWWVNPLWLVLGFILPIYLLVYFAPFLGDGGVLLRAGTYLSAGYFALGLAYIGVFAVGISNGFLLRRQRSDNSAGMGRGAPLWLLEVTGVVAAGAYLIWFHELLLRPWYLVQIFIGEASIFTTREEHSNIPGVTSFTQFGIVFFVLYFDAAWRTRAALLRRHHALAALLIVLTIFRVFVWGERLALIEVVVPAAVIAATSGIFQHRAVFRGLVTWGPFVGVGVLLAYFALTEVSRSWAFYQDKYDFWPFVISRVTTYYYTALNNGAGLLATMSWPADDYQNVLGWLYKTPLLGGFAAYLFDIGGSPTAKFLAEFGDPEFTNMSGIFTVFFDLGVAGALIFAWVYGFVVGAAYIQFVEQRGIGRFLYPALFVSLLELMRVLYVSESRFFLVALGTIAAAWLTSQVRPPVPGTAGGRGAIDGGRT